MKYIFIVGAPGSKWSSVAKNIYYSPSLDQSDYQDTRVYSHSASGSSQVMHLGAYFDPGMEFGNWFDKIDQYNKESCEEEFDRPFSGTGVRIIKSHVLANHIDFLKSKWPECPIVLVHRSDDSCLGWWVKCGEFNIKYPKYDFYYKDLPTMSTKIAEQNSNILTAWNTYTGIEVNNNIELSDALGIQHPPGDYQQKYNVNDIKVKKI
jgi:hypothetical protein